MHPGSLVPILIFAIPILGIMLAGYKEWLKFRAKQQELGASTQEVEETIQALRERLNRVEQERDALIERVQNLETIVTSEAWDALQDPTTDAASLPEASDPAELESSPDQDAAGDATEEQAKRLARRLRR
jgi:predicted nuclease with TOPRIM domain